VTDSSAPSAGYFLDANGVRRWWDGKAWTDGPSAVQPARPEQPVSEADRRALLDRAVTRYVQNGYVVQSKTDRQAVVGRRQQVKVLLNLALALITGGLWLIVLAIRLLDWPVDRVVLTVDDWGVLNAEFS
jgi:hypothetical protein